jgi:hypothetical protein
LDAIVHAPVIWLQHAGWGQGLAGAQDVPNPWKIPMHVFWPVRPQPPEDEQHAPMQAPATHVEPLPRYVLTHPVGAEIAHPPIVSQHAPFGQGSGVQEVLAGEAAAVPDAHAVPGDAIVHRPEVVLQQAVACGHITPVHVFEAGDAGVLPGEGHPSPTMPRKHAPVVLLQQAEGCGHWTAVQDVPPGFAGIVLPVQVAPGGATVHAPLSELQHAVG